MKGLIADIRGNSAKYGRTVSSYDLLKCAAIFLMTCDHIGYFFEPGQLWWRVAGRCCVPIWFFLAGYGTLAAPKRELYWLAGFMILADIAFSSEIFPVNILVTIMVARFAISHMATRDRDAFMVIAFALACFVLLPITLHLFEYGSQVFLFTLAGYYRKQMPDHWLGGFTLCVACLIFIPMQAFSFAMPHVHAAVMMSGVIGVCFVLGRFSVRRYSLVEATPIAPLIRLIGRNTQYYYAFHVVLFLAISRWLHPVPWQLVWFRQ